MSSAQWHVLSSSLKWGKRLQGPSQRCPVQPGVPSCQMSGWEGCFGCSRALEGEGWGDGFHCISCPPTLSWGALAGMVQAVGRGGCQAWCWQAGAVGAVGLMLRGARLAGRACRLGGRGHQLGAAGGPGCGASSQGLTQWGSQLGLGTAPHLLSPPSRGEGFQ